MRRRAFIALLGAKAAWPRVARAQPSQTMARVGLLSPFSASASARWNEAFRQGLRDLGWVEGRNIRIEHRYADGKPERLPELAADLIGLNVDIILASISTDALVAKAATRTIPIVMASAGDPVGSGLVDSLARPGGNVTGLSQLAPELAGKRLEVLKELSPGLSRVAVLWNPTNPSSSSTLTWEDMQAPARQLALELHSLAVRSPADFAAAFEEASRARAEALVIAPDPVFAENLEFVAAQALKARLPSIFHLREFAVAGGLASYGIDRADQFRRAAHYVDRILKGANPAELPVEQPTKFELAINLKTASALGLDIPATLLARADEVIE